MTGVLQEIRYAVRRLRQSPGFTTLAVITLALGIGADTSIFTSVYALLLRPFAFPDLNRVVVVWETLPQQNAWSIKAAPANFLDWTHQSTSFRQLAAVHSWDVNLRRGGVAERAEGYRVTPDFFPLLGIAPQLGRNLGTADFQPGPASVVVIGYGFWQRQLGGDADIVGQDLLLNGRKFTVVGVAGRGADFPAGAELWAPMDLTSSAGDRSNGYLQVLGRLKKDTSVRQAAVELEAIASRLAQRFPDTNRGHGIRVARLVEDVNSGTREFVSVLMGAAVFVLLLACVNVMNLQLARISRRRTEMAVRLGLGARRWQLIRPLLVESMLLAGAAAVLGAAVSNWAMALIRPTLPPFIVAHVPGLKNLEVDSHVLWFTVGVAVLTGILTGAVPAWRFSWSQIGDSLKDDGRGASTSPGTGRLRSLLVVVEVALALVLLAGAGLMVKGFGNLMHLDMGFAREGVLTFHVALPEAKYRTKDEIANYYDRVLRAVESLPAVSSVACVTTVPSAWNWQYVWYAAEGRPPLPPGQMPAAISQIVTPDFLATLRVPLLKGRFINEQDSRDAAPVVAISQSMARYNWPEQDPIGRHLKFVPPEANEPERRVIGIVGDVRTSVFDRALAAPTVYLPLAQTLPTYSAFAIRSSADPSSLAAAVSTAIRRVDPDVPAYDVRTLEKVISDDVSGVDFSARMMFVDGLVALMLAAAGIFGVMAYSVTQRTREIGIRMTLGASRADVLRLVLASAVRMVAAGLAIGLCLSLVLTLVLSSVLFGVVRMDTPMFALMTLVLAVVAAIAAYVPAHWATRVDPIVALRYE
jgi:putative ABC transport system permease protein